ncbi:MAG: site-2 protease family protein [Myxococcota bacterium]
MSEDIDESKRGLDKRGIISALILFFLTLLSTTLAGIDSSLPYSTELVKEYGDVGVYLCGLKFSIPLLLILGAHEAGHFFMSRRYGIRSTPPYFIPAPYISPFGTLGAVIIMREKIADKRILFDIGAAGPYAGLIVGLPFLVFGIHLSDVVDFSTLNEGLIFVEGDSILYYILKLVIHGRLAGGKDILTHPFAMAGWFGMFITALNLLPVGQLDGGHIAYAIWGRGAHKLAGIIYRSFWALGIAGTFNYLLGELEILDRNEYLDVMAGWLLWALIIKFAIGVYHPPVGGEEEPLDRARVVLGVIAIIVMFLTFPPIPLRIIEANALSL